MMLGRNVLAAASALVLALGCGESHMNGDPDAAIVIPDGALNMPDAGSDAGPPASNVGETCGADEDCTGAANTCLTEPTTGLPGGYCSAYCASDEDCPSDATCVMAGGGGSICLRSCDPTQTDQCRAGYGCVNAPTAPPVCYPGCEDDTDCPTGLRCEPGGGFSASGSCYDPSASIGDACTFDEPCPMSAECYDERFSGWPGGACLGLAGCDPAANTGCPDGAVCVAAGDGTGICIDGCAADADCRAGYACRGTGDDPTRMGCYPACTDDSQCTAVTRDGIAYTCNAGTGLCGRPIDPTQFGQACTGDGFSGGCRGGECLAEAGSGWPRGTCTYPACSLSGSTPSATCPSGGVCTDDGQGDPDLGVCVQSCTPDSTSCRSGYACVPLEEGSTDGACRPACTSDDQCTATTSSGARYACDTGTGLCVAPG